jgi:Tfp pilus assembly protein PilV
MATSVVILLSLLNTNTMSNMFDLNYLKTQEKNKLLQIRKQNYETKRSLSKALMYNNNKTYKTYNFNNYNIMKERKR